MKLVFQADWNAMKNSNGSAMLGEVVIQVFGISQGRLEECFVQAIRLLGLVYCLSAKVAQSLLADVQETLYGRMPL